MEIRLIHHATLLVRPGCTHTGKEKGFRPVVAWFMLNGGFPGGGSPFFMAYLDAESKFAM